MGLHLAGGHSSFDRKLNLTEVKPYGVIEVPVRTLDEILVEAGEPPIDFISMKFDGLVRKKISSIGDSRDCQSGSSINRTTRMIRLVPALLCAPPSGERGPHGDHTQRCMLSG
jgi:hypothetical protein